MLRVLISRLRGMFSADPGFDAELNAHLEMLTEENVRRGMTPDAARGAARRSLGNLTQIKESRHEGRGFPQIEIFWADLKYGARSLRANPGFTTIAALTLTLGIGVVTTVFTAYDAVALKPLPVGDPGHVVRLERWPDSRARGTVQYAFSFPEYRYLRDKSQVFSSIVAASIPVAVLTGDRDRVQGELVTANYFSGLQVPAYIGRTFSPEEDRTPGANAVVVLSHAYWQRRFQSGVSVLGRVMKLNGIAFTIVGVAAREFGGTSVVPQTPDFWAPVSMEKQLTGGHDSLNRPEDYRFQLLARLGSPVEAAEAETSVLIRQFETAFRPKERTINVTLQRTALLGNTEDIRFQASALIMTLIVGLVLMVGCVNIANMTLARGAARQRELGVRLALGASRGRMIRQLLTESLLVALLGGAGGVLFSIWTTRALWLALQRYLDQHLGSGIAIPLDPGVDARVLLYAFALSLFSGLMFGLSPALRFSRADVIESLKREAGSGERFTKSRLRGMLIAAQAAVSLTLLLTAGLLVKGLARAEAADPGFDTRTLFAVQGAPHPEFLNRLKSSPGIQNAAVGTVPFVGTWTPPIAAGTIHGRTLASYASDAYFDTLGIPILRGRGFTAPEAQRGANLAVISESTAKRFFPNEDPLGRSLSLDLDFRGHLTAFEVVGVARDVRFGGLSRIDAAHVYLAGTTGVNTAIVVRASGDARLAQSTIRGVAASVDPSLGAALTVMNIESGPVELLRSFARLSAMSAAALAALAIVLAGVGIYGVMSYLVSQRTREIGIRAALGAARDDIFYSVILRGLRPVLIGLALGYAAAFAISALLHSMLTAPEAPDVLFGVSFYDPPTFIGLSLFLLAIACIASAIPARRALAVEPMAALRHD